VRARLRHRLAADAVELPTVVAQGGRSASFVLPADMAAHTGMPAGLWQLSFVLTPPAELAERETNSLPLLLAPDAAIAADAALGLDAIVVQRTASAVSVRLFARPQVRPEQTVVLALGTHTAVAAPRTAAGDALVFAFALAVPAGDAWLRLRVDGVDSLLVDKNAVPPRFRPGQQVTVPA
jgi:hypothetical protein